MVNRVTIEPVSIPLREPLESEPAGDGGTEQEFTEPVAWNSKQQCSSIVHDSNNFAERSVQIFDVLEHAI